jgi:hypothetical protein
MNLETLALFQGSAISLRPHVNEKGLKSDFREKGCPRSIFCFHRKIEINTNAKMRQLNSMV